MKSKEIMTNCPVTINPMMSLGKALEIMEAGEKQISVLPVLDTQTEEVLGMLRLHDVYNPTINDRLFNLADQELKEDWFLMLERPVIIGVGRLSKQKGFDILIRAFNEYADTSSGTLVILGEGNERSNLEKLINCNEKEKVRLQGFVENPYKFIKSKNSKNLHEFYKIQ